MSFARRRSGVAVTLGLAALAVPGAAHASAVDLGTAAPFVVLGGSTVTNTGVSVLGGDLGVSPGSALTGFGTAVVGGATHDNDAVALQAQSDLTTAYAVAAGQPVAPADDLTGTDLGSRTLTAGAYRFSSSAQLTGELTLDAQGDPAAQFVFEIGSTLTTATASSVRLVNGASACHVFWQVGSSATLGTVTAFQGNVLALTSISLNTGATATGRMLARNGAVTLQSNVLTLPGCDSGSPIPPASTTPPVAAVPAVVASPAGLTPAAVVATPAGLTPAAVVATPATPAAPSATGGSPPAVAVTPVTRPLPPLTSPATPTQAIPVPSRVTRGGAMTFTSAVRGNCTAGFHATVRGRGIRRVVFDIDGRRLRTVGRAPFHVYVRAAHGTHTVRARIAFKDGRRPRSLRLRYKACAAAVLHPIAGPAVFTG